MSEEQRVRIKDLSQLVGRMAAMQAVARMASKLRDLRQERICKRRPLRRKRRKTSTNQTHKIPPTTPKMKTLPITKKALSSSNHPRSSSTSAESRRVVAARRLYEARRSFNDSSS